MQIISAIYSSLVYIKRSIIQAKNAHKQDNKTKLQASTQVLKKEKDKKRMKHKSKITFKSV